MLPVTEETGVSGENWREERDRLVQLLEGIESGKITHVDEDAARAAGHEPGEYRAPEEAAGGAQRAARLTAAALRPNFG